VGLLDNFEKGLERAVNGAFAKTFRSGLQPVEITAALKRELDTKAAVVSRDRVLVPNTFRVRMSRADLQRMSTLGPALVDELTDVVQQHAASQGFQFAGGIQISLEPDEGLSEGMVQVDSSNVKGDIAWTPVLDIGGRRHPIIKGRTVIGRGSEADTGRPQSAPLLEYGIALVEVEAGLANVPSPRYGRDGFDPAIIHKRCVFLNKDCVGTVGHWSTRKDAHSLAGAELTVEAVSGRCFSDNAQCRCVRRGDVSGTNRITVHGRGIEGGLGTFGCEWGRKNTPVRFLDGDRFTGQRLDTIQNAFERLIHRQQVHVSVTVARQSPDFPPFFSRRRIPSSTMPLSRAFAMS